MKKWLSLLLCLIILAGFSACGETEIPGTDSATAGASSDVAGSSDSEPEEWAPLEVMENKVIVSDYGRTRIVVYDLDLVGEDGNLERAEVWALENHYSASVKYREDTVYGDVLLLTCDGSPMMFNFETKELIWSAPGKASSNPHSIEILPSGNIVTAATDGLVRIYNTAACVNNGATVNFTTQPLVGGHGVLWDPKYEVVWALGTDALVAYRVKDGENGEQILAPVQGMGAPLPRSGGHDLSADLLDDDFLWCTSQEVYCFDKENNEWVEHYENYAKFKNKSGVKGFGNNLNKNYIFTQMKGDDPDWLATGKPEWTTDTIYYAYWKSESFLYVKECVSPDSAFYKARVFYGKYQ